MDNKEIYDVMAFFGRARDEYSKRGMNALALKCDNAIALAQFAALLGLSDQSPENC
jgi:hypothetical protein